jgi:transcriptional regulator with XRE-family HTH domain
MKQLRLLRGFSQKRLGACVGLTFQQIQKYEKGADRMAASRLYELTRILGVPVSYLFEDIPKSSERLPKQDARCRGSRNFEPDRNAGVEPGFDDHKRETLELVRAYYQITAPGARKKLLALVKELAASSAESPSGLPPPS